MKESLASITRFSPYKLYNGKTIVTEHNWNSLRRPGMTLKMAIGPPPFSPHPRGPVRVPNIITIPKPPKVTKEIYQEVNKLLNVSRSWTPDAESLKGFGIGHLLRLWTNAVDPDNGDDSDNSSIRSWSSSGSSEIVD